MKKYLSLTTIIIFLYACASVSSPTGGKKDDVSPKLIESNPKDQKTNFNKKEISLTFDEWIKVENLNKELIITPRINNPFEFEQRKESLTLKFENDFSDSTTYTLNFRKSIKDITEGNIWENPRLSFSTGNYLDSIKIKGRIIDHLTETASNEILVGLYKADIDTANLRQGEPLYFTTSDDKGFYQLTNIKAGNYLLYAFQDNNDNLINESATEDFGFYPDTLKLFNISDTIIDLSSYHENQDTLKIKKYGPAGKDFKIDFNKGINNYSLQRLNDSSDTIIYSSTESKASTIRIYKENFSLEEDDSLAVLLRATDSTVFEISDTIYVKYRESKVENEIIKITTSPNTLIRSGNQKFFLSLSKPVYKINYDSIFLSLNDSIYRQIGKEKINVSNKNRGLEILINIDEKELEKDIKNYSIYLDSMKVIQEQLDSIKALSEDQDNSTSIGGIINTAVNPYLYFGQGAFIGIEEDSTKKESYKISFKNVSNYGTVKGKVLNAKSSFIIELLTDKFQVVDTLYNQESYQFNYVKPGTYKIRVIQDLNDNKQWDPGNPLIMKTAEPVTLLKEELTVKANWELIDKNIDLKIKDPANTNNVAKSVDKSEIEGE